MWIDTQAGSERELCPRGSFNHFYGAFLPGFLWPIILLCLVVSLYLVYLRVLPCVRVHLLAKMDSSEGAHGRLTSLTMGASASLFEPPRSLSAHV